jgi:hypothetical protein
MTKLKAFSYHFLISIVVFSLLFGVFILYLYPQPYFTVTGGWQGLLITALVDLVLGPLLSFIVYNASKAERKLIQDYVVIALLQVSALAYGINTIYQQHPVANVFWKGSFFTVNVRSLTEQGFDLKLLRTLSDNSPAFVYLPDQKEKKYYLEGNKKGQVIPRYFRADLYAPLQSHIDKMIEYKLNIDAMLNDYPFIGSALARILEKYDLEKDDLIYSKLISSHKNMIVIFDEKSNYISHISLSKDINILSY